MFTARRLWLFSALVVLTLFFALCGWRNAHLPTDEHGVWLKGALYGARQVSNQPIWGLDVSEKDCLEVERALKQKSSNGTAAIIAIKTTEMPTDGGTRGYAWIQVEKPILQNQFHATLQVSFGEPRPAATSGNYHSNVLTFTRSPLAFWDNKWHLDLIDKHPHQDG